MLTQQQIQKHLRKPHWTTICIPGRNEDGSDASWFAYDRESRKEERASSAAEAKQICDRNNKRTM